MGRDVRVARCVPGAWRARYPAQLLRHCRPLPGAESGGFLFGIGGPVTYKKSSLPDTLREIPLSDLVLETDSPYLPPVPYRGKRNESAYVGLVACRLAEIYGTTPEEVAAVTTRNARALFDERIS